METQSKPVITVENTVNAPVEIVWEYWTNPEHITEWNSASPDWHTPKAENDLRPGGRFVSRMEAKDGSMGFDFGGTYDVVTNNEYIEYTMDDTRNAKVNFSSDDDKTHVTVKFEAERQNPLEMQQAGWQAILDSFKKYTEAN